MASKKVIEKGMARPQILKSITEGATKAATSYIFTAYILPFVMPSITILLGYLQKDSINWFYIWIGFLASLAFTFQFLVKFDEWRQRGRVENKLNFSNVLVAKDIHKKGYCLGIEISSDANFPIEYGIKIIKTRLKNLVPIKDHINKRYHMPPKGRGWYYDYIIELEAVPSPGTLEGSIEFEVEYGRPSKLGYTLSGKKEVILSFNAQGQLEAFTWNSLV